MELLGDSTQTKSDLLRCKLKLRHETSEHTEIAILLTQLASLLKEKLTDAGLMRCMEPASARNRRLRFIARMRRSLRISDIEAREQACTSLTHARGSALSALFVLASATRSRSLGHPTSVS